jgi:hypothetical protein
MNFLSSKRFNLALVLATLWIIYVFNFTAVYINILKNRSLGRQIIAYALNILIFTAGLYLAITLFSFLYSSVHNKKIAIK